MLSQNITFNYIKNNTWKSNLIICSLCANFRMDGLRDKRRYAFSLILDPVKLTYRAYACLVCVTNIFTQATVRTFEWPKEKKLITRERGGEQENLQFCKNQLPVNTASDWHSVAVLIEKQSMHKLSHVCLKEVQVATRETFSLEFYSQVYINFCIFCGLLFWFGYGLKHLVRQNVFHDWWCDKC